MPRVPNIDNDNIIPGNIFIDGVNRAWGLTSIIKTEETTELHCSVVSKNASNCLLRGNDNTKIFTMRSNGSFVQTGAKMGSVENTLYKTANRKKKYLRFYYENKFAVCTICNQKKNKKNFHKLTCKHQLCLDCVANVAAINKSHCPYCRKPFIVPDSCLRIYSQILEKEKQSIKAKCDAITDEFIILRNHYNELLDTRLDQ
tara:strand:+ start:416 stop:1018 length:603 start_codon:yes stop_codon:yes gene_type:complete